MSFFSKTIVYIIDTRTFCHQEYPNNIFDIFLFQHWDCSGLNISSACDIGVLWVRQNIHPPTTQPDQSGCLDVPKKEQKSLPKLWLQYKNNIWKKKILQLENFSNIFSQEKRIFNFSFTLKLRLLYIVEHRYYYSWYYLRKISH